MWLIQHEAWNQNLWNHEKWIHLIWKNKRSKKTKSLRNWHHHQCCLTGCMYVIPAFIQVQPDVWHWFTHRYRNNSKGWNDSQWMWSNPFHCSLPYLTTSPLLKDISFYHWLPVLLLQLLDSDDENKVAQLAHDTSLFMIDTTLQSRMFTICCLYVNVSTRTSKFAYFLQKQCLVICNYWFIKLLAI